MRTFLTALLLTLGAIFSLTTAAAGGERAFYQQVEGKWAGNGEIIAGKYKGTRFNCQLDGLSPDRNSGIVVDGKCRIGMFSQPINASIEKLVSGYRGQFMDGAKGDGLDVVGGRFTASRLTVDIRRNDLHGVLVAHLTEANALAVTVSVRVRDRVIPVVTMALRRTGPAIDDTFTSSIKR